MFHILVVDDDKNTRMYFEAVLKNNGYTVTVAKNGEEALDVMDKEHIDLVVLDIMMPNVDGYEFTKIVRESDNNLPILMVSAKQLPADKQKGFIVGTDDYITKPFNPTEVAARVKSQLRRYMRLGGTADNTAGKTVLTNGGIELDDSSKTVTVDGEPVNLTPTELQLLKFFMENLDKVFSPKEIYRRIWKDDPYGAEGTVAVHIRHLREKIELCPAEPRYLKAIWGQGYKIEKQQNT